MIGFESDHDPELSAVISLGGRISANRDVTNQNKNKNFNSCFYLRFSVWVVLLSNINDVLDIVHLAL